MDKAYKLLKVSGLVCAFIRTTMSLIVPLNMYAQRRFRSYCLSVQSFESLCSAICGQSKIQCFFRRTENIRIKHGFSCINIRQVRLEVLKTEAEGRGFQHLPRDLANVNALKNHVRSLLLHKNWKHLLLFALFLALFCFAFSPMSRERYLHGLCPF